MSEVILTAVQAKQARSSTDLSQGSVARTLGINRTYLSQFENGHYLLGDTDLAKLREFYDGQGFNFQDSIAKESDTEDQAASSTISSMPLPPPPPPAISERTDEIFVDYEENNARIQELLLQKIETDWWGEVHEKKLLKSEREILILMAQNYIFFERLEGNDVVEPVVTGEPKTLGEHISSVVCKINQ